MPGTRGRDTGNECDAWRPVFGFPVKEVVTGEPCALKGACTVCAVRRFEISLSQTGGTREVFLSYQLT